MAPGNVLSASIGGVAVLEFFFVPESFDSEIEILVRKLKWLEIWV
jgi:hypothetical protein